MKLLETMVGKLQAFKLKICEFNDLLYFYYTNSIQNDTYVNSHHHRTANGFLLELANVNLPQEFGSEIKGKQK